MTIQLVPSAFLERIREGVEYLSKYKGAVRIISHYDADGIAAAAVLSKAMMRYGFEFHTSLITDLHLKVKELNEEENDLVIIADMGSGDLDTIENLKGKVLVLDHHVPRRTSDKVIQLNPRFYDIDGTTDVSASTLSFVFAVEMDEKNWNLADIALMGAIGDKQDIGGFSGINKSIVEEAINREIIEERKAIRLSHDSSLLDALVLSCDPYIKGISGDKDKAKEWLDSVGLDPKENYEKLGVEDKRKFHTAVLLELLGQNTKIESLHELVGPNYWSVRRELYLRDLSGYANACGRLRETGTGLACCLGNQDALGKAKKLRTAYKKKILEGMLRIENEGVFEKEHIQFFYSEVPELAGTYAGLSMQYLLDPSKPTFTLSVVKGDTKISARGTRDQIRRGLDLAMACRTAGESAGGLGGGHPIASGASVPKGKEEFFLEEVDHIVAGQMK